MASGEIGAITIGASSVARGCALRIKNGKERIILITSHQKIRKGWTNVNDICAVLIGVRCNHCKD